MAHQTFNQTIRQRIKRGGGVVLGYVGLYIAMLVSSSLPDHLSLPRCTNGYGKHVPLEGTLQWTIGD